MPKPTRFACGMAGLPAKGRKIMCTYRQAQCWVLALCAAALLGGCPPPNALHSVTVLIEPEGAGQVYLSPDQAEYRAGTEVTLEAVAAEGWQFVAWERQEEGDNLIPDPPDLPDVPDVPGVKFNTATPVTRIVVYDEEVLTARFENAANGPVGITTPAGLPEAYLGVPYRLDFMAEGGVPPYVWALDNAVGSPPAGFTMTSGGAFRGTPASEGIFTFGVQATDSIGQTATGAFSLAVVPEPEGESPEGEATDNVMLDGGFERGPETPYWVQFSTSFEYIVCDTGRCGTVNGIGPHTGLGWLYLGGNPSGGEESSSASQQVIMPRAGQATLQFYLAVPRAEKPFNLRVVMGRNILFELDESGAGDYPDYRLVSLDVSGFADGEPHTLVFLYYSPEQADDLNAVFMDDVCLVAGPGCEPVPAP